MMAVITISRQFGAGGLTMGKALAEKLGYLFFDNEIIQMISQKAKVSSDWVSSIEKEAGGKLHKLISSLIPKSVVDNILADDHGYIDEHIYVDLLKNIIRQIAESDDSIILGRGSQYILKDHPNAIHLLLVADLDYRVKFMRSRYNLTDSKAKQVVSAEDRRRINLYRKFDKTDFDRPGHYHLTLNMSKLDLDKATGLICSMVA